MSTQHFIQERKQYKRKKNPTMDIQQLRIKLEQETSKLLFTKQYRF